MWAVRQTRRFARQYKKLHDKTAADVDIAVAAVQADPQVGERKKVTSGGTSLSINSGVADSFICSVIPWMRAFSSSI